MALLDLIANEATKLMRADRASLFLLDRERGELWSKVVLGSEEIRFDARLGIAGAVALVGETINVEDAYEDLRFYKQIDLLSGYRTQSLLAVPLRTNNGEIIGTFEVLNKETGVFSKADEEILKALAAQAAISLKMPSYTKRCSRKLVSAKMPSRRSSEPPMSFKWRSPKSNNSRIACRSRTFISRRRSRQSIISKRLSADVALKKVLRGVEQVASSDATVLIRGETGTGKEARRPSPT